VGDTVGVGVEVGVDVGLVVGEGVAVDVGVEVDVGVAVDVGMKVGVAVGIEAGVEVGVGVGDPPAVEVVFTSSRYRCPAIDASAGLYSSPNAKYPTPWLPISIPVALATDFPSMESTKAPVPTPAVSCREMLCQDPRAKAALLYR
jgi:hypothetical protein